MEQAKKLHVYMPYPPVGKYSMESERSVHLLELIRKMSSRQQAIVRGVLKGETWGEIGAKVQMHRANVKRSFKRIMRRLRDEEKN
jgi:DNA-binding NarL/FixJ family response regulator